MHHSYRIAITTLVFTLACQRAPNGAEVQATNDAAPDRTEDDAAIESDVASPMPGPPYLSVSPSDLTSQMRGEDIFLSMGFSTQVSTKVLSEIEGRVRLQSSRGDVPLELVEVPESAADQARNIRRLQVVLSERMASEWHELLVDLSGIDIQVMGTLRPMGNELYVVRMHPESAPVLKQVQVCRSLPLQDVVEVFLDFSEPIDFVPRPSNTSAGPVEVYLGDVKCAMLPSAAEQEAGDYIATLQFRCLQVLELRSLEVVFLRELRAASGRAVTSYDSAPISSLPFDFSLAFGGDECFYFHGQ